MVWNLVPGIWSDNKLIYWFRKLILVPDLNLCWILILLRNCFTSSILLIGWEDLLDLDASQGPRYSNYHCNVLAIHCVSVSLGANYVRVTSLVANHVKVTSFLANYIWIFNLAAHHVGVTSLAANNVSVTSKAANHVWVTILKANHVGVTSILSLLWL